MSNDLPIKDKKRSSTTSSASKSKRRKHEHKTEAVAGPSPRSVSSGVIPEKQAPSKQTNVQKSTRLDAPKSTSSRTRANDTPHYSKQIASGRENADTKKSSKSLKKHKNTHGASESSTLPVTEVDFPRGGGTQLSAYEHAKAKHDGIQEAEKDLSSLKRPPGSGKIQSHRQRVAGVTHSSGSGIQKTGRPEPSFDHAHQIQGSSRIEHLSEKRLVPGTRLAGLIIEIKVDKLIVALPWRLVGHVPITEISTYYTQKLEEQLEDDEVEPDDEEQVSHDLQRLDEMFKVGQWLQCVVTTPTPGSSERRKRSSPLVSAALRITLSLEPARLNSGVLKTDLSPGMILTAAVRSMEDKGYILDLCIPVDPNISIKDNGPRRFGQTITAYVASDALGPISGPQNSEQTRSLEIGLPVLCRINQLSENGSTCVVSIRHSDISKSLLVNSTNIDCILPLQMVPCNITAIQAGQGLQVAFLGYFQGSIDISHIPFSAAGLENSYCLGQKIRARILWETLPPKIVEFNDASETSLAPKVFSLSLLDHCVQLSPQGLPKNLLADRVTDGLRINEFTQYPVGYIFQGLQVVHVAEQWGLYLVCTNTEDGRLIQESENHSRPLAFAHISAISDSRIPTISSEEGPYKIDSVHEGRVLGVCPIDGILQVSLKRSVIDMIFLAADEIPAGEFTKVTVKKYTPSVLFVSINQQIEAMVWPDHYSDSKLWLADKKFTPGNVLMGRVLYTEPEKNRVVMTLRKSLMDSDLEIITSYRDAEIGMVTRGIVTHVHDKFIIVTFFGQTKAKVSITEAAQEYVDSMTSLFTISQLVTVKIIDVDVSRASMIASVKQALEQSSEASMQVLSIGDPVLATVRSIHPQYALLDVKRCGGSDDSEPPRTGRINLDILAKHQNLSKEKLIVELDIGKLIQGLFITSKDKAREGVILGPKEYTKDTAIDTSATLNLNLDVGDRVIGEVISVHESNIILDLSKDSDNSSKARGLLSLFLLAKERNSRVEDLRTKLEIGEKIHNLVVKQRNIDRGLSIVGLQPKSVDSTVPVDSLAGEMVVGTVTAVGEKSVTVLLRKEDSGEQLETQGTLSLAKLAKHRKISVDELISNLSIGESVLELCIKETPKARGLYSIGFRSKKEKPTVEKARLTKSQTPRFIPTSTPDTLVEGQSVLGTIQAINDHHILLSLKLTNAQEGNVKDTKESQAVTKLGVIATEIVAARRNTDISSLKTQLSKGDEIRELVVKKVSDKKKVIVGFEPKSNIVKSSATHPKPESRNVHVGDTLDVEILAKCSRGYKVSPLESDLPGQTFYLDLPDISDDYDHVVHFKNRERARARVVARDTSNRLVFVSTRPSILDPKAKESQETPPKDRSIIHRTDVGNGDRIRGFVIKIQHTKGLFLKIGTNMQAQVKISEVHDKPVPHNWFERFQIGQVVSGRVIISDAPNQTLQLSLRSDFVSKVPEVGQSVLVEVAKIETYGLFLQIDGTMLRGLCHRSQIWDDEQNLKEDWSQDFREGMKLKAAVVAIEPTKKRINFTLKPSIVGNQDLRLNEDSSADDDEKSSQANQEESVKEADESIADRVRIPAKKGNKSNSSKITLSEAPPTAEIPKIDINLTGPSLPSTGFEWSGRQPCLEATAVMNEKGEESESDDETQTGGCPHVRNPSSASQVQSPEELEKLLLVSPNSAKLWNQLILYYTQQADIPQARETVKRALSGIYYREETEKWKVWVASLNLENTYGTEEEFAKVFADASVSNDTKTVWLKVAHIFGQSGKIEKADDMYSKTVKRFSQSSKVWTLYGEFLLKNNQPGQAGDLLARSLKSLPQRKRVKTINKFAQLEFKHGDPEKGRTIFEGLVAEYPKRSDVWTIYIDMEIKNKSPIELIRGLFLRMLSMKFNTKRTQSIFKKWLSFEVEHGDQKSQQDVLQRAQAYVASLIDTSTDHQEMDED